ncbi:MAG: NADPH-dependent F420 reductase [Anaerolineae bacterium]|nr:NADPH-dependent F420 reductase [Anaerolineae bacterium]
MVDTGNKLTLAVLGGTGKEGSGLASRWALSGYNVIIGSRDAARAAEYATNLNGQLGLTSIRGMGNPEAALAADVVILSVPYSAHQATLDGLKEVLSGKVVVDITVPLQPPKVRTVHLPEGKSAALEAQALLGESTKVVAAFQNVSAEHLADPAHQVDCDVLVCGNDAEAKTVVIKLVEATGMKGVDAGSLANSIAVEALTPVLLYINKAYGIKGSGIRITGIS